MQEKKSLWQAHLATLLFGGAGLFGKLVSQHALIVVFFRVLFSAAALLVFLKLRGKSLRLDRKRDYAILCGTGVLLAAHWTSFF